MRQVWLKNNWNYSSKDVNVQEENEIQLTREDVQKMFRADHTHTGKIRITCDPASTGVDNMVMCAWDSFHLLDVNIVQTIAASDIEYPLREFMNKHGATNSQLSLDIQKFEHLKKPFAGARFFNGSSACSNIGKKSYVRLKDEAAYQMVRLIKLGIFSIDINLQNLRYTHQLSKAYTNVWRANSEEAKFFTFTKGSTMNKGKQ